MKLSFSTKDVPASSFLELCNLARSYGFSGFEIHDAQKEKALHSDSLFRLDHASDAKRWLRNRSLSVSALTVPEAVSPGSDPETFRSAVAMARNAGIETVIVRVSDEGSTIEIRNALEPALELAESSSIEVLFETAGRYADSSEMLALLRSFSSVATGVSWNVRETYYRGSETAESTIKTLGAYIRFVRLGDMKDGNTVMLGEGGLPVDSFVRALSSLNYDGFLSCDWNEEITDYDLVLTHFHTMVTTALSSETEHLRPYTNRSGTGTFPWKQYEIVNKTFPQLLDLLAEEYPDQYAFRYPTLEYTRTYAEFRADVDRVAASFVALGVKPGYHVAIWATNIPQWFLTFWAATKIGAVLVTVNTAYKIHEIEYLLRQSDTHTLVMIESAKDTDYQSIIRELCPELESHEAGKPLYAARLPFLRNVVTVGFSMPGALTWREMLSFGESVSHEEVRRRASAVRPDDVCNMQYTSGTTGFPKGVMLTHNNVINNGKIIGDRMDLSTADRMMIQVPMFHCFGMVLSMTSMMTHAGTLCPIPYFSAKSSLSCITQEKITCFNGVPTMFISMFNHPDFATTDFSHIRTGIMAGANCPPELMRRAADEMNMKEILSVYGQTESSPGCTMGEVNESIELRTETVGSAFPGVSCKIIDPETGKDLPDGQNGEFVARGFNIMKGYYKMPEATSQTIDSDGWLHTGDICCRTPEGYYKVTGRIKDMIIRGGENIYPREIEEFYLTHPKIRDIQVIAVPDPKYGEEACAWVILHSGESVDAKELTDYGLAHMASHKVPRYFLFVSEFPLNAAGKVLKYKMKEQSIEMLNLS
ncbi:MAG: AMP-binding protein [Clostridia bacterium]|nr:AMP-binding protein [Clostridia bacterium]